MTNLSGMQMMQINNNDNKNWTVGRRDPGELENFVSFFFTACLQSPERLNSSALLEMFLSALRPQNDNNVSFA